MFPIIEPTDATRRRATPVRPSWASLWLLHLTSTFLGALLAGLVLLLIVRWYVLATARDAAESLRESMKDWQPVMPQPVFRPASALKD